MAFVRSGDLRSTVPVGPVALPTSVTATLNHARRARIKTHAVNGFVCKVAALLELGRRPSPPSGAVLGKEISMSATRCGGFGVMHYSMTDASDDVRVRTLKPSRL